MSAESIIEGENNNFGIEKMGFLLQMFYFKSIELVNMSLLIYIKLPTGEIKKVTNFDNSLKLSLKGKLNGTAKLEAAFHQDKIAGKFP